MMGIVRSLGLLCCWGRCRERCFNRVGFTRNIDGRDGRVVFIFWGREGVGERAFWRERGPGGRGGG